MLFSAWIEFSLVISGDQKLSKGILFNDFQHKDFLLNLINKLGVFAIVPILKQGNKGLFIEVMS